jgi:hypothetical protein
VCVDNEFRARDDNERESGCHEYYNVGAEGEYGFRRPRYQETEDYIPTSTYPSDVGDELPWEGITEAMTLEQCSGVKMRLKNDLEFLELLRRVNKACRMFFIHCKTLWMHIKRWGQPLTILSI